MLQNLPTVEDEKNIFSQCVERFINDIHASLASSSKFESIPGSENMSMRRMSPWFSPKKKDKCHSIKHSQNTMSQNLSERVKENENFNFPLDDVESQREKRSLTAQA